MTITPWGCHREIRHATRQPFPGFFVYSAEELRTQLRSQGQQDDLVDNPYEAVRRTGDHAAIILMTHDGRHAGAKAHLVWGGRILKSIPL
jgi:hypothetical protein